MTDSERLGFVLRRLSALFDVQRMVLFGSRARGDASPDSDYDLLVVANTEVPFIERQGIGLAALAERDFSVDLLIYTPVEALEAASVPGTALFWAEREGRVFYAK